MKKRNYFKYGLMLLFAGIFVYSTIKLAGVWSTYNKIKEEDNHAIEDFLIFDDSWMTEPTTTLYPQTDLPLTHFEGTTTTIPSNPNPDTEFPDEKPADTTVAVTKPPQPTKPTSIWPQFSLNWTAMKNTNPEIFGWIWMFNSTVNFPLLHTTDNEKYVTTAYNGTSSSLGSIFLDYRASTEMTSRNSIIYGHNGNNGIKFGALLALKKQSYYDTHKYICVMTQDRGLLKYEIFSAYITDAYSSTYRTNFSGDSAFLVYLAEITSLSVIKTGVEVHADDKILTLSTCTNNHSDKDERFVVHARLMTE